jgi:hypothetical protein
MKKEWIWTGTLAAAGMVAAGLAVLVSGQGLPPGPMPTPTVNVGPVAAVKAANPAPSPAAKNQSQKTTIGVGVASVKASGPSAYWTDLVDIDGDGVEEDTQFLFDKKRGILYTYKQDAYQCADGSSQNGDVLMGIYTQGNIAGKQSGSGWYVVAVKAGQCGEKKAGLFGCRFDASGKPTSCGTAKVKEESGEVDLVVKK